MDKPLLISRFDKVTLFINLLVCGICFFLSIALYDDLLDTILILSFNDKLSLCFLICGLYLLWKILVRRKWELHAQRVVVKSGLGVFQKSFAYTQITGWYILHKSKSTESLYVVFNGTHRIVLPKDHFSNYAALRDKLTKGKKEMQIAKRKHQKRSMRQAAYTVILLFVGCLIGTGYFVSYRPLAEEHLHWLTGELKENAQIKRKLQTYQLELQLKEYPFIFTAHSVSGSNRTLEDLTETFSIGKQVQFAVSASDYQRKIAPKLGKPIPHSDFLFQNISLVSLKQFDVQYLQLREYNTVTNRSQLIGAFAFGFLALVFLLMGLRLRKYIY